MRPRESACAELGRFTVFDPAHSEPHPGRLGNSGTCTDRRNVWWIATFVRADSEIARLCELTFASVPCAKRASHHSFGWHTSGATGASTCSIDVASDARSAGMMSGRSFDGTPPPTVQPGIPFTTVSAAR